MTRAAGARRLALVCALAVAAVSLSAGGQGLPDLTPSLRELASARHLLFGTAVQLAALQADPQYADVLATEYSALTPENGMKWDAVEPEPGVFDFGPGDALVSFALDHGMAVRGHNLVWQEQNPAWLTDGHWTRDELVALLRDHIRTVVGHYRGRVAQWDVVNEPLADDGSLRRDVWETGIGSDYIAMAFRWAREADPHAELFLNEYGLEFGGPKADAAYRLVAELRADGVPIDGVGLQLHDPAEAASLLPALPRVIARFNSLGLDVAITEMDVWLPKSSASTTAARRAQAGFYATALQDCLRAARCSTFSTWGFTDRYSWVPAFFPGYTDALPFAADYRPKPAALALQADLRQRAA
jgi:endo-1,4-beta-xylanase